MNLAQDIHDPVLLSLKVEVSFLSLIYLSMSVRRTVRMSQ